MKRANMGRWVSLVLPEGLQSAYFAIMICIFFASVGDISRTSISLSRVVVRRLSLPSITHDIMAETLSCEHGRWDWILFGLGARQTHQGGRYVLSLRQQSVWVSRRR